MTEVVEPPEPVLDDEPAESDDQEPVRKRRRHDDDDEKHVERKYCQECGDRIRAKAVICPSCGVPQADADYPQPNSRAGVSRDGVKAPLLISAIANIVVGLIWASTCIGVVFTIPMVILCIFEFMLWSKADDMSPRHLGESARSMAVFEIVVGLANTPTLICGILNLINGDKLRSGRKPIAP